MTPRERTMIAVVLCTCASVATLLVTRSHVSQSPNPLAVVSSTIVAEGGQRLTSLFDGSAPDPRHKAVNSLRGSVAPNRCSESTDANLLDGITQLLEPTVSATSCPYTICGGTKQVQTTVDCAGAGCLGSYKLAVYSPGGDDQIGNRNDATYGCYEVPGYTCTRGLCNTVVCLKEGPPPCETCNIQGEPCSAGKKCSTSNCCDVSYSCSSGQAYCGYPGAPPCPSTHTCQNGCCVEKCPGSYPCDGVGICNNSWDTCTDGCCEPRPCGPGYPGYCPSGSYCDGAECKQAFCNYDEPYCPDPAQYCADYSRTCQNGCCVYTTPIILDLNADGYSLTAAQDGVDFDFRGNGTPVRISWTAAGSDDAFLVLDRNGNGTVDDGSELFSNVASQPEEGAPNGFEALKVFDQPDSGGNLDGSIDSSDAIFPSLLVWQDANHNGISEASELSPLSQSVITAIELNYQEHKWADAFGNQFRYRAKTDRQGQGSGQHKWAYDVLLVIAQ